MNQFIDPKTGEIHRSPYSRGVNALVEQIPAYMKDARPDVLLGYAGKAAGYLGNSLLKAGKYIAGQPFDNLLVQPSSPVSPQPLPIVRQRGQVPPPPPPAPARTPTSVKTMFQDANGNAIPEQSGSEGFGFRAPSNDPSQPGMQYRAPSYETLTMFDPTDSRYERRIGEIAQQDKQKQTDAGIRQEQVLAAERERANAERALSIQNEQEDRARRIAQENDARMRADRIEAQQADAVAAQREWEKATGLPYSKESVAAFTKIQEDRRASSQFEDEYSQLGANKARIDSIAEAVKRGASLDDLGDREISDRFKILAGGRDLTPELIQSIAAELRAQLMSRQVAAQLAWGARNKQNLKPADNPDLN
jgi:hypothetical protein